MITTGTFSYKPDDSECEKASNGYLMSLIALMVGLPLPIVNLIATGIFYLENRKGPFFVRWHVTQALLSQASLLLINSAGWWWTLEIIFENQSVNNSYIAYIFVLIIFNLTEFIVTIYTAIQTRKGVHVEWFFYREITNKICKPNRDTNF